MQKVNVVLLCIVWLFVLAAGVAGELALPAVSFSFIVCAVVAAISIATYNS